MLIAGLACWILTTWLDVRDRLGHWRLTLRDAHGVEQGHGDLNLRLHHWVWVWQTRAPYVAFDAILDRGPCGHLDLSAPAAAALNATGATCCTLDEALIQLVLPAGDHGCSVFLEPDREAGQTWRSITWGLPRSRHGDQGEIVMANFTSMTAPPLTVTFDR
jgi:hypothetical protein